jgi:hypothetical protein
MFTEASRVLDLITLLLPMELPLELHSEVALRGPSCCACSFHFAELGRHGVLYIVLHISHNPSVLFPGISQVVEKSDAISSLSLHSEGQLFW